MVRSLSRPYRYDAVVVGAGPNGLAAAVVLARSGYAVQVIEAHETIGGGARTGELTLPGFQHDICSAVHPLGIGSPFLRTLPLEQYGLEWIQPPLAVAHPLDDGSAITLTRSIEASAQSLGLSCPADAQAYLRLMTPYVERWPLLEQAFLGPLRAGPLLHHPLALSSFGLSALWPASAFLHRTFKGVRARALLAGLCAHSMLPLTRPGSAAVGLVLATLAHVYGWPIPRGGSQRIVDALAAYLRALGGEIVTGVEVTRMEALPLARAYLFDVTPHQLLRIAGSRLPAAYQRSLRRYRYGPGAFKLDYALAGPIPWRAKDCLQAGTVHLGGTLDEIAAAERQPWRGECAERPYVLVAQQSLFDSGRAPQGQHTAWVYCHVPNGSTVDMTGRIEAQLERFAPGFRERILARHISTPLDLERYNANYVGGDINGGVQDLGQLFTRPTARLVPYSTAAQDIFLCSSATPPGGGVHGLCGYFAAQAVLQSVLR